MPKVIDDAKLFRTVIEMLVSHGYEGAITREIADAAGVNEATLFRKYGSKAELFEKAIEHQLADTPLNKLAYTGELEVDLTAIVEAYAETNERYGEIIPTLLAELPRHPELKGAFRTPWGNIQVVVKIIQAYQTQGLLKAESPLNSLNALIGPLMTGQMMRRANLDWPVPELDASAHVQAFLYGRKR
jgi:AcrR family transcriptional regulator